MNLGHLGLPGACERSLRRLQHLVLKEKGQLTTILYPESNQDAKFDKTLLY